MLFLRFCFYSSSERELEKPTDTYVLVLHSVDEMHCMVPAASHGACQVYYTGQTTCSGSLLFLKGNPGGKSDSHTTLCRLLGPSVHNICFFKAIFPPTVRSAHSESVILKEKIKRNAFLLLASLFWKGPMHTQQMHESIDERSSLMKTTHRDVFAGMLSLFNSPDETLQVVRFEASA